ncbi:MAG: hypothetical protein ACT4QG_17330 [Sporichthyaceae bacterium]
MSTSETDVAVAEVVKAEIKVAERLLPRPRRHSEDDAAHEFDEVDLAEEEHVLIATEYFDTQSTVAEDDVEADVEADTAPVAEAEAVATEEVEPIGARSAALRARKAAAEAQRTQRLAPVNRRHGVLGLAMLLVLAYQVVPALVPGGHVGVNLFLAAMAWGLWSSRRVAPLQAKGGRRRAELVSEGHGGRRRNLLGWTGVVLLAIACWAPDPTNVADRFSPLAIVAAVLLLIGITAEPPGFVARAAATAPLRMLGRLTFPLLGYLVALLGVLPAILNWEPNAFFRGLGVTLSAGAAYLTMRHYQRGQSAAIERAKHRNPYVVGAIASLAALGLAFTAPGQTDAKPAKFQAAVESSPLPATTPALPFADRCWAIAPTYVQATCSYGADDAKVTVALTGDQSAASWLPALQGLALAKGWQVTSYLASNCSPAVGSTDAACTAWIDGVAKSVENGGYDLIVVSGGTGEAGGTFGEKLRREGLTVIGMPELLAPQAN